MIATKDNYGKIYIRLDNKQVVSLKTFQKRFPEWTILQTNKLLKQLEKRKEVIL